jgi:hypothetical protein
MKSNDQMKRDIENQYWGIAQMITLSERIFDRDINE